MPSSDMHCVVVNDTVLVYDFEVRNRGGALRYTSPRSTRSMRIMRFNLILFVLVLVLVLEKRKVREMLF